MSVKVVDKDMGFKKLMSDLHNMQKSEVVAGLFDNSGIPDAEKNVAYRGHVNEYGFAELKIPARPFMRGAYANNTSKIKSVQDALVKKVIEGRSDAKRYSDTMGEFLVGLIKDSITNGDWVANSPDTIALKGSSRPLIDSGEMRNSVTYKVRKRGGS